MRPDPGPDPLAASDHCGRKDLPLTVKWCSCAIFARYGIIFRRERSSNKNNDHLTLLLFYMDEGTLAPATSLWRWPHGALSPGGGRRSGIPYLHGACAAGVVAYHDLARARRCALVRARARRTLEDRLDRGCGSPVGHAVRRWRDGVRWAAAASAKTGPRALILAVEKVVLLATLESLLWCARSAPTRRWENGLGKVGSCSIGPWFARSPLC